MAVNKTLLVYVALDIIFLGLAGILIGLPIADRHSINSAPKFSTIAQDLLLNLCPLRATVATGVLMVFSFLVSVPAMFLQTNRGLLKFHVAMVSLSAFTTLGVGLAIWFDTLKTKTNLATVWNQQDQLVTRMLQDKFVCCGYTDATVFVMDAVCPDAATAASHGTCVGPFSAYANKFLDVVFTAFFGVCALDGLLILAALCVLKERIEQARYRMIDMKNGYGRG